MCDSQELSFHQVHFDDTPGVSGLECWEVDRKVGL